MSATPDVRSPRYGFQSPNVRTRVQEKEELSDLNDRLATYIDRMRHLEQQNTKLSAEITTSKESVVREIDNVKALYEAELSEARKLLDETAKEKALLQLENNKLTGLTDDLRHKLEKETTLRQRAEDELKRLERRLHEKESLLVVVSKERKELDERCKDLEQQLKDLQDELDKEKAGLEQEIIRRVDAENRAQTLQEESDFNRQIHQKEVSELRTSAETVRYTMETDSGAEDYDSLLRNKLQELRDEFEEEAENAKQELEEAYKHKYDELRLYSDKERSHITRLIEKNTEIKQELDNLRCDYGVMEAKNIQLQKRINELENLRALDRDDFKNQLNDCDDKIKDLNNKIDGLTNDYESLLGIKIALDMEISAYRKMLEGEEERLNIPSPPATESRARTGSHRKGTKRSRPEYEAVQMQPAVDNTAAGSIEVSECDAEGKFVKLFNKGEHDEPLGGWHVHRVVDGKDEEAIEYKFTPKYVLKSQQYVMIWSQSSGVKHKTPTDLVLKNVDWLIGGSMVTTVINPEAEIVAKYTMLPTVTGDETGPRRTRKRRTGAERESCVVM